MKLVIFGERPGPNTDPTRPLYPHTTTGAAANLIRLMGVTREWYLDSNNVKRYNVVDEFHTSTAAPCMRQRVWKIMSYEITLWGQDGVRFLFLGRAAAQGGPVWVRNLPWAVPRSNVMVIPHPSGRNRWYNSLANTHIVEQALRSFLGRTGSTL